MDLSKANQGLTKMVAFYDWMTSLVDNGRAVHVVYWGFSNTFVTDSLIILVVYPL